MRRSPAKITTTLLALAAVLAMVQTVQSLEPLAQDEAWWQDSHKAKVQFIKTHPDTQLLLVGDSITENLGTPPYEEVWNHYFASRHAANPGLAGDTCHQLLWRLRHGEVDGVHPTVAELLIGTNDKTGSEIKTESVEAVVDELRSRLPSTHVILLGILPSRLSDQKTAIDAEVNARLFQRYAGSDAVTYIDLTSVFAPNGQLDGSLYLEGHDGALHPNPTGADRMEAAIEPTLSRYLPK